MNNLSEIAEKLSGVYYLATTDGDQPHVRPFDGAAVYDGELYIGTGQQKAVFSQIQKNPKIEIFSMAETGPIRFSAEAYFEEDAEKNRAAYEAMGKNYDENVSAAIRLENIVLGK